MRLVATESWNSNDQQVEEQSSTIAHASSSDIERAVEAREKGAASSREAGGSSALRAEAGGEEMPGRLIMDQQGPVGSQDLKKDRGQAHEGITSQKRDFAQMQGTAHANGSANGHPNGQSLANGVNGQHQLPTATSGHSNGTPTAVSSLPTPPPLDQSWRSSDANKPMGVMLQRLAQQCFADLNDTCNKMSQMPPPPPAAANGVVPHINDPSRESVERKRVWMDFANGQRDRFIKALVLSDWARSEHDMAKLVDLKVWQEKQSRAQDAAKRFIGEIKHGVVAAKMRNPNIEDAMELLATGKSSKWPDLMWIPPKKLPAKRLVATLNDMNVMLATRLNLHEELPLHFRDYSIANGRATFRVPGEFEVDLSIAEEDPSSQFYLIDLRFTFTPTPSISDPLRNALEAQTNGALSSKGLQGCYEFLHNFVLTHKINVFRSQAVKLFREKWFGCLVTETQRRVFAIHYWRDQAGKKSWIEFGINTGKVQGKRMRKAPTARHSVRWFRHGQEVQDDSIEIDWNNLDLDAILTQVIAKHASWTLSTVEKRLRTHAGTASTLHSELCTSASNPGACKLGLSLPGLRTAITLRLEPVTGLMTIFPKSRDAATAERNFNRNPIVDNSASFTQLLCRAVQDRVRRAVISSGWQLADLRGFGAQPNFKALFGQGIVRSDILHCARGWKDWALCTTYSLSGQNWWAVRLNKQAVEQGKTVTTIAEARAINVSATGLCRADLSRIRRLAEAEISFAVLAHDLEANQIPHHIDSLSSPQLHSDTTSLQQDSAVAVYLRLTPKDLKSSVLTKYKSLSITNWVRIAYQGIVDEDEENAHVRHDIRLTVDSEKLKHLHDYFTNSKVRDADIAMNGSGGLALSLRTPLGQPYVTKIIALLDRCRELNEVLLTAPRLQFTCTTVGLQKITFTYGAMHQYIGSLVTNGSGTLLKLDPPFTNPHQRIRVLLERLYNKARDHKFWALALAMNAVQPLLESLVNLETSHAAQHTLLIHSHDVSMHTVEYRSPFVPCRFKASVQWYRAEGGRRQHRYTITPHQREGVEMPAAFSNALDELSRNCGSMAEGWFGNNKGGYTATHPKGLPTVFRRLDDFMRTSGQAGDATVNKVEKQETPVPNAKPTLNRNPSKHNVSHQQKPNGQTQPKPQPRPQQQNQSKQSYKPHDSTANQTLKPNQKSGKTKQEQEVIELD